MQKLLVAVAVVCCFAAVVTANVADAEDEGVVAAAAAQVKADRCGAKGGHCEVGSSCGGSKLAGLCDSNGSGVDAVCCVPKRVAKGKGKKRLSPKAMAAKRKAALLRRKKAAKKAAAAAAAMTKLGAKAKADAKDLPAKKPTKPGTGGDGKSVDFAMKPKPSSGVSVSAQDNAPKPAAAGAKKAKGKGKGKKHAKGKGKGKRKAKKHAKKQAKKSKGKGKKRGMRVKKGSRGVDVAQRTTKKHWKCLKKAGWDWAVIRGFRASNKPDPHAVKSLKHARAAGYSRNKLGVYLYPCAKCGDAKGQINRMIKHFRNAGVHKHFTTIWLDIEGSYWPTGKPRKQRKARKYQRSAAAIAADKALASRQAAAAAPALPGYAPRPAPSVKSAITKGKGKGKGKKRAAKRFRKSRAFFRELVRACRALKQYRCGVYTSASQWTAIMGKRPIVAAKGMPLWYPKYELTPDASTDEFEGFSGWNKAWAKQYSENQNVCGVSVDVNVRA